MAVPQPLSNPPPVVFRAVGYRLSSVFTGQVLVGGQHRCCWRKEQAIGACGVLEHLPAQPGCADAGLGRIGGIARASCEPQVSSSCWCFSCATPHGSDLKKRCRRCFLWMKVRWQERVAMVWQPFHPPARRLMGPSSLDGAPSHRFTRTWVNLKGPPKHARVRTQSFEELLLVFPNPPISATFVTCHDNRHCHACWCGLYRVTTSIPSGGRMSHVACLCTCRGKVEVMRI